MVTCAWENKAQALDPKDAAMDAALGTLVGTSIVPNLKFKRSFAKMKYVQNQK